jgi:DNA-directed RNA polymerase specialized sigma24 family protein
MPPHTQRLQQIIAMYAVHDHQLRRTVRRRGSDDPQVVDDACAHAWMKLLIAEDVDLSPPRWGALAWLTTCAVRRAWLLNARGDHEAINTGVPAVGEQARDDESIVLPCIRAEVSVLL